MTRHPYAVSVPISSGRTTMSLLRRTAASDGRFARLARYQSRHARQFPPPIELATPCDFRWIKRQHSIYSCASLSTLMNQCMKMGWPLTEQARISQASARTSSPRMVLTVGSMTWTFISTIRPCCAASATRATGSFLRKSSFRQYRRPRSAVSSCRPRQSSSGWPWR